MTGRRVRTLLSLAAALAASSLLLLEPPGYGQATPPQSAGLAWPGAQRGSVPAELPDGSAYAPSWFLDARTSIGVVQSGDGATVRLVLRRAEGSLRELRRLPARDNPSFPAVVADGDDVVWAESRGDRDPQLWTIDLARPQAPRLLTAAPGDVRFYQSDHDLVIADGRVRWVAAARGRDEVTEVRSVALTGGSVQSKNVPGSWQLSAWPWLVDGVTSTSGASVLRDVATGRDVAVKQSRRAVTNCTPRWCRVVSLNDDGLPRIDLMHPDGSNRHEAAEGTVQTAVADVGLLDRFEVYAETGSSDVAGTLQLMAYDLIGQRTVRISPDAANVVYRGGVLWWSTGTRDSFLWHTIDLRTV